MTEDETNQNQQSANSVFDEPVANSTYITNQVNSLLHRESFRKRVNEVIVDHTNSVPFMRKVQEYADDEIDKKLFKNAKVIIGIIIGWVVTAGIAYLAALAGK